MSRSRVLIGLFAAFLLTVGAMPAVGAAADERGHGRAGELIAFAAVVQGRSQLFTVRPDGTGLRRLSASRPDLDLLATRVVPGRSDDRLRVGERRRRSAGPRRRGRTEPSAASGDRLVRQRAHLHPRRSVAATSRGSTWRPASTPSSVRPLDGSGEQQVTVPARRLLRHRPECLSGRTIDCPSSGSAKAMTSRRRCSPSTYGRDASGRSRRSRTTWRSSRTGRPTGSG